MIVPFNSLAPTSRIWIYQSDKKLTEENKKLIQDYLITYCDAWAAHGQPLYASFDIRFDHFIILAVDESHQSTSGCSIDDSVRAVKQIETITGASFFNRNLIAFLIQDDIQLLELSKLKENFHNGIWNAHTLSFNNLVATKAQLETEWIVSAANSWLKRYIPQTTVKI